MAEDLRMPTETETMALPAIKKYKFTKPHLDDIKGFLQNPELKKDFGTATWRFNAKKAFEVKTFGSPDGHSTVEKVCWKMNGDTICGRPIPAQDELHQVLCKCHAGHGGRDHTYAVVDREYARVTKEIVQDFIGLCKDPRCVSRLDQRGPRGPKSLPQGDGPKPNQGGQKRAAPQATGEEDEARPEKRLHVEPTPPEENTNPSSSGGQMVEGTNAGVQPTPPEEITNPSSSGGQMVEGTNAGVQPPYYLASYSHLPTPPVEPSREGEEFRRNPTDGVDDGMFPYSSYFDEEWDALFP